MADPLSIAVIGSGVVGTATGAGFTAKGRRVVFCDVDPARVALLKSRGFEALHASALVDVQASAYLISVPSPTVDERIDTSYVREAAVAVGRAIVGAKHRPIVVVRSTVPPGTTERIVIPALELASGRRAGQDFGVCMNPEFLRAAAAERDFLEPRVIVIGALDEASAEALRRLYAPWGDVPVHVMSLRTAEATKYVSNLFNATKISFFNEMHRALAALGAEPKSAFEAVALGAEGMWNPRYGTRGGLPYGGGCLPKDAVGFLGFARDHGLGHLLPVLRATIQVNDEVAGLAWPEEEPELARAEGHAR